MASSTVRLGARLAGLALASALVPAAFLAACSSDDNGNPTPPVITYPVDATTVLPDTSTPQGDDVTGTTPGDDASVDAKEEPIVREDVQSCTLSQAPALGAPDAGCWNCAPQLPSDFLNKCSGTGVTCVPFDNGRLPGYDGGALPPTN